MHITIKESIFVECLRFSSIIQTLIHNDKYKLYIDTSNVVAQVIQKQPCYDSVLMGYDFHISNGMPKLIEVNNNAGGLFSAQEGRSAASLLPQPISLSMWDGGLEQRLLKMFAPKEWQCIAILDEDIQQQFMFPEMQAFKHLLERGGKQVFLVSPHEIHADAQGLLYVQGEKIDVIYNRHTDFYLSSNAMAHIRNAYIKQTISMTPNPYSYAYIGDKTRMRDWWTAGLLDSCLESQDVELIRQVVPRVYLLADMDKKALWQKRKHWVFKPTASHAGKGVLLGKATGRKRFAAFDPLHTVVQEYIPPDTVLSNGDTYNYDLRLYMYKCELIAVAGRIWQGMIMNFRTSGSGFVPVEVI